METIKLLDAAYHLSDSLVGWRNELGHFIPSLLDPERQQQARTVYPGVLIFHDP
jgi:hypothetical protein